MQKGFSTLEILIAMAVLISSFTAVILLSSAASLSTDSQIASEALSSVRKALETQQSLARKDFKLVVATTSPTGISGVPSATSITVEQIDAFTKKVKATVTWQGTFNRAQNVSLSALVTNFGNAVGGDTCSSVLLGDWKAPTSVNSTLATVVGDSNANAAYPITDIDAYQKRLYITSALSENTGDLSPSGQSPDSGGDGNGFETSPTSAYSNGGSVALNNNGTGDRHRYFNYNISVPPGATVTGIEVRPDWFIDSTSGTNTVDIELSWDGGATWSAKKTNGTETTNDTNNKIVGGPSDSWGRFWTASEMTNANFRVRISMNSSNSSRDFSLDWIPVKVYFTKQFYVLNLANPASPTFISGLATSTLSTGLNAVVVATSSIGSYAYVATDSTSGTNQLQVIDLNNLAKPYVRGTYPSLTGTGMGGGVGNAIFYKDGYAYIGLTHTTGPEFNIVDVSTPSVPVWKGGYSVGAAVNAVYVKDGYAYVTTNDSARELVILNITNPASPTLVGVHNATPDVPNFGYGRALYTVGDTVYMGRSWINGAPEFLTLDASSATPVLTASRDVGPNSGNPFSLNGIVTRDYLAFLLLGSATSGGQLQILSATSTLPWGAGTVSLPTGGAGIGGVSLDCEGNYIYAASVDSTNRGYITSVTGN